MRYYLHKHNTEDLFDKYQLKILGIQKEDLVKQEGSDSWIEAIKVDELKDLFGMEQVVDTSSMSLNDRYKHGLVKKSETKSVKRKPVEEEAVNKEKKNNRLWIYAGIGILVLLIVMALTNPLKAKHYNTIEDMAYTSIVNNGYEGGESEFQDMFVSMLVTKMVESSLDWHDCVIFGYTSVKEELYDERNIVSFGIFGHVYTISQDKMDEFVGELKDRLQDFMGSCSAAGKKNKKK